MRVSLVTIISANYLAYARVLAASVRVHAAEAEFRVLVVDRPTPEIAEAVRLSGLHVTFAQDLGLVDFPHLAYKFDLVELNTALKPTFLKAVLREGFDAAVYLDPDIELYAPPSPVYDALGEAAIVFTPHTLAPAMDGLRPSDIDFLRNGTYNLGFVAVKAGAESAAFLDWWERRCLQFGYIDTGFGTFVDQKWADLAVAYFAGVKVLRHRGCNVAYWNLHERQVSIGADGFRVGHEALVFFHFSGVKADKPGTLSPYQTRHTLESGTALAKLVANYTAKLQANEHENYRKLAYSYGRLDNGTVITPPMRRALCAVDLVEGDPFDATSKFQRRLNGPLGGRRGAAFDPGVKNTLDMSQGDVRMRIVNLIVRGGARFLGASRMFSLLRYASFLTQRSNFAAVLLKRPFDVAHRDRPAEVERGREFLDA